jgi:putative transposase
MIVNHKKILRIMKEIGIEGLYPKKSFNTSFSNKGNKIYPYLLGGLKITRPNQVWATDITYININGKFVYFMAIVDLYSRYIIFKELSPSLESSFCVYTLQEAFKKCVPEIFNTDQGSQFTSNSFINTLEGAGVKISMDHKGRCFDNIFVERLWRTIKQEAVYFYRPSSLKDLKIVLEEFVDWYNNRRIHQSLDYKRPVEMYYEN